MTDHHQTNLVVGVALTLEMDQIKTDLVNDHDLEIPKVNKTRIEEPTIIPLTETDKEHRVKIEGDHSQMTDMVEI